MLWFICEGTATERRWEDPPKVGLVLGGSGAKGAAAIGNTKGVGREKIPVD